MGALIAIVVQAKEASFLSMLSGLILTIGGYITYTTLLPFQLLGRKPPLGHAIFTIAMLSMALLVPMALGESLILFYWAFTFSHLALAYRIAKVILQQEQRKGIWEHLNLMWLLFNPLVGLWSYTKRLENMPVLNA